jgi:hypothetical protein
LNGDPFVNLSLTFSSFFLLLMDLRRNRLDGRLTRLRPAPTLDKYGENTVRDAVAAPALLLFRPARVVNSLVQKYI